MRIFVITHAREYEPEIKMRWHRLPLLFKKYGHKVEHVLKKDWKWFYLKYLKFKPDVVITSGLIGSLPCILKKLHLINAPIIHDWTDNYTEVMGKIYGIDRVAFLEHFIIKNSDYITTPSKSAIRKCEIFGKKAYYIPHGVDLNFDVKPAKLKGKVKVVYIGSVSEYKLVHKLLESADGLNCDIYIFGKVEIDTKNIPKNVHFMGLIKHKDVPKYLKSADILVITANDDSCLKMFEYIKAGKCILGLKGRINYFLTHMENAYLTDNLKEGLNVLIKNPLLRNRLAENVKKIKVKSWEEIGKMYLEFLKNIKYENRSHRFR